MTAPVSRDGRHAALLTVVAAVGYLATLSRNFSGDTIQNAIKAETEGPLAGIDAYHVFNQPLAWLAWRLGRLSGLWDRALVPIQVPNALAGGLTVGLMYLLARRLGLTVRAATVAAAGLGVSCATWLLATDGEYVTPGLALALVPLVLLFGRSHGTGDLAKPGASLARNLALGASLAVAGLAYQTNLALLAVAGCAILLSPKGAPAQRRRDALQVLAAAAGFYGLGYSLSLAAGPGLASWATHSGMGSLFGVPRWTSLPHGVYALVRSLVGFPGLSLNGSTGAFWTASSWPERAVFLAWYLAAALILVAPLYVGLRRLRFGQPPREVWLPLLVWALLSAAFAWYWVPGDISFWVMVLVPWWLLVGQVIGDRPVAAKSALLLALANGAALVVPNHILTRNTDFLDAQLLAAVVTPGDQVFMPRVGRLQMYAYYLTRGAVFVPQIIDKVAPEAATAQHSKVIEKALDVAAVRGGRLLAYDVEATEALTTPDRDAPDNVWRRFHLLRLDTDTAASVFEVTATR